MGCAKETVISPTVASPGRSLNRVPCDGDASPARPTVRVVVESQRPAGSVWRTAYRCRVAVERLVGSVEDYATIEQRSVFRNLMAHGPVPQFEIAAVFGLPIFCSGRSID